MKYRKQRNRNHPINFIVKTKGARGAEDIQESDYGYFVEANHDT